MPTVIDVASKPIVRLHLDFQFPLDDPPGQVAE